MADFTIRKKDLENLGRKLMKEVYKFLHDEYILSFEEMKVEKDNLEKYLVKFYFKMIYESKYDISLIFEKSKYEKYLKEIEDIIEDEIKYKKYLKEIEDKIEDESLDIKLIFDVLDMIKLDFEIDEDLFDKKKHLYIFILYMNFMIHI